MSHQGAFTPTCSNEHCPSYILNAARLKQAGVDAVYCTAVNDAFVMGAWAESLKAGDRFHMLADGSAEFARKVGLEQDLTARAFGVRSKRYTMLVVDGVVKVRSPSPPSPPLTPPCAARRRGRSHHRHRRVGRRGRAQGARKPPQPLKRCARRADPCATLHHVHTYQFHHRQ